MNNSIIEVCKEPLKKYMKNMTERKNSLMTELKICSHEKLSTEEVIYSPVSFFRVYVFLLALFSIKIVS